MDRKKASPTQVLIEFNTADVARLAEDLKSIVSKKQVTPANVLFIVTQLMIVVAKYNNLTGSQKKKLVIYVLRSFIKYSDDIENDTKQELLLMFDIIIPDVIDLLVTASNSKFAFKVKKSLLSCCN